MLIKGLMVRNKGTYGTDIDLIKGLMVRNKESSIFICPFI